MAEKSVGICKLNWVFLDIENYLGWLLEEAHKAITKLLSVLKSYEDFQWLQVALAVFSKEKTHLVKDLGLTDSCKVAPKLVMMISYHPWDYFMHCFVNDFFRLFETKRFKYKFIAKNDFSVEIKISIDYHDTNLVYSSSL